MGSLGWVGYAYEGLARLALPAVGLLPVSQSTRCPRQKPPPTDVGVLPALPAAVNRFALVRKLSWDKSGIFNNDAWDAIARK